MYHVRPCILRFHLSTCAKVEVEKPCGGDKRAMWFRGGRLRARLGGVKALGEGAIRRDNALEVVF